MQNLPALAQSSIGQNSVSGDAAADGPGRGRDRQQTARSWRPTCSTRSATATAIWCSRLRPDRLEDAGQPADRRHHAPGHDPGGAARAPPPAWPIPGFEVGGKTGTAQLGTDPPTSHAWIIGWAGPPGDAKVAVAVIVERQTGASEATGRPGRRPDRPSSDGEDPAGPGG